MRPEQFFKRWRKCLKNYASDLRREWELCRRTGEVESIHRLRVLLRRLRTALRLGAPLVGKERVSGFRRWASHISDAVAHTRDLDVTLEWLEQQPDAQEVAKGLRQRRQQAWRLARRRLVRLASVPIDPLKSDKLPFHPARKLHRRLERTLEKARQEIQALQSPLDNNDAEHWHELRRDLRRIRYLREIALSGKEQKKDALLKKLLALQDLLGNAQNCVAAMEILRTLPDGAEVKTLSARLEQQRQQWLAKAQESLRAFQRSRALKKL